VPGGMGNRTALRTHFFVACSSSKCRKMLGEACLVRIEAACGVFESNYRAIMVSCCGDAIYSATMLQKIKRLRNWEMRSVDIPAGYVERRSKTFCPFSLIFLAKSDESAFPFLTQRAITHSTPAGRGLPE
jgi:hypothetical protein